MKKISFVFLFVFLFVLSGFTQIFITRNGTIRFFSEAPLENIEAINRQVFSALNTENGEFAFRVVMRSFSFEKALMQQHFNDNFVESQNYPNATFQGIVKGLDAKDLTTSGKHDVLVEGELTIKDVTRVISERGTLDISDGQIHARSVFMIRPEDYNVGIPSRYARNIAREIEITVDLELRQR